MKKRWLLIFIPVMSLVQSCGVGGAEDFATEFHSKMDSSEYHYIISNMIDEEALAETGESAWLDLFMQIEGNWGKVISREQEFGFHTETINGVTQVQLDYKVEYENMPMIYERIFVIDRGDGFKLRGFFLNTDKGDLDKTAGNLN